MVNSDRIGLNSSQLDQLLEDEPSKINDDYDTYPVNVGTIEIGWVLNSPYG